MKERDLLPHSAPEPRLSEDGIQRLLRQAKRGNEHARNQLIRANLGLVIDVAKRFHRHGSFMELGDLIQQGCLGLFRAIKKFDLNRRKGEKVRFATYAVYWIEHFIYREIENRGRTVAVPTNVQSYLRHAARAKTAARSGGHPTSLERTAAALGISKRRLNSLQFAALQGVPIESVSDEEPSVPAAVRASLTSAESEFHIPHEQLRRLLDILPARERFLIEHRHGLIPGQAPKILAEVAKLMGICRERVRQIEIRAIKRMRAASGLTVDKPQLTAISRLLVKARVL